MGLLLSVVFSLRDALLLLGQNLSFVGEFPWSTMPQYQDACETGDDDTVSTQPPWVHGGKDDTQCVPFQRVLSL